jgi:hypothetical protein
MDIKDALENIQNKMPILPCSNRLTFDDFIWIQNINGMLCTPFFNVWLKRQFLRDTIDDFEHKLNQGLFRIVIQLKEKVDKAYHELVHEKMNLKDHLRQIEAVFLLNNMLVMRPFAKKILEVNHLNELIQDILNTFLIYRTRISTFRLTN